METLATIAIVVFTATGAAVTAYHAVRLVKGLIDTWQHIRKQVTYHDRCIENLREHVNKLQGEMWDVDTKVNILEQELKINRRGEPDAQNGES